MNYQDELRAKLDAAHVLETKHSSIAIDVKRQEHKVLDELSAELEFSQYDLQESDLLRALKIEEILGSFGKAFEHRSALKLFYILCRIDIIEAKNLYRFSNLEAKDFKNIINSMAKEGLVFKNEDAELELTMDGKSLASRIGIDIFF